MHKYFAKTLFLGKKITFLPECHSTSDELMHLVKKKQAAEGDILFTNYQKKGKGQRGNAWLSEPGKNLLFSYVIAPKAILSRESYFLNIITGLAMIETIRPHLKSKTVELKWPNDVYVDDRKLSGILIETILEKNVLSHAVIGVGLNVNQRDFYLNTATSLYIETGREYDREEVMETFLVHFEACYLKLRSGERTGILKSYYDVMRWRGELHRYRAGGEEFDGEIIGIDDYGRLVLKTNNLTRRFDVKEIEFLY